MDSERIPRSLLRGLASELQSIDIFLAWKIPCTLVQGIFHLGFLIILFINFLMPLRDMIIFAFRICHIFSQKERK